MPDSKSTSLSNVTFRLITFQAETGEIHGIGLWFNSEREAEDNFKYFHDYIASPDTVDKSLDISFTKDNSSYHLDIIVGIENIQFHVQISGIESENVSKLKATLSEYPYIFITAGYIDSEGEPRMLPLEEYNIFRSILMVDDEAIIGHTTKPYPINKILGNE